MRGVVVGVSGMWRATADGTAPIASYPYPSLSYRPRAGGTRDGRQRLSYRIQSHPILSYPNTPPPSGGRVTTPRHPPGGGGRLRNTRPAARG